jgi:hypothetical protein
MIANACQGLFLCVSLECGGLPPPSFYIRFAKGGGKEPVSKLINGSGFQPLAVLKYISLGFAQGWYSSGLRP